MSHSSFLYETLGTLQTLPMLSQNVFAQQVNILLLSEKLTIDLTQTETDSTQQLHELLKKEYPTVNDLRDAVFEYQKTLGYAIITGHGSNIKKGTLTLRCSLFALCSDAADFVRNATVQRLGHLLAKARFQNLKKCIIHGYDERIKQEATSFAQTLGAVATQAMEVDLTEFIGADASSPETSTTTSSSPSTSTLTPTSSSTTDATIQSYDCQEYSLWLFKCSRLSW